MEEVFCLAIEAPRAGAQALFVTTDTFCVHEQVLSIAEQGTC
jgi:hypothetical protein